MFLNSSKLFLTTNIRCYMFIFFIHPWSNQTNNDYRYGVLIKQPFLLGSCGTWMQLKMKKTDPKFKCLLSTVWRICTPSETFLPPLKKKGKHKCKDHLNTRPVQYIWNQRYGRKDEPNFPQWITVVFSEEFIKFTKYPCF